MKKKNIIILVLTVITMVSCSTTNNISVVSMKHQLPLLNIDFQADIYDTEFNGYEVSKALESAWNINFENNMNIGTQPIGTIKFRLLNLSRSTSYGGSVVSYVLGGLPSILGASVRTHKIDMSYEITICNNDGQKVWTKTYSYKFDVGENLYNVDSNSEIKNGIVENFRNQLSIINSDLDIDFEAIVNKL